MRLKPNDIMQKGDVIHYKNAESHRVVASYAGRPVSMFRDDEIYFVERPEPDPVYEEKIHILRAALRRIEVNGYLDHVPSSIRAEALSALELTE